MLQIWSFGSLRSPWNVKFDQDPTPVRLTFVEYARSSRGTDDFGPSKRYPSVTAEVTDVKWSVIWAKTGVKS